ncbi:uncharacterized protein LOC141632114 [Silene latifolia]|uniref:uncharacterized protein LOC141632114 n=1 Tax=Silene latifolia TaxID=37657 RepID=UPI003D772BCE
MKPTLSSTEETPHYTNFLAEVTSKKESIDDHELVVSKEECSSVVSSKVPIKLDDPGNFSITCTVGNQKVDNALCDLGASVSIIPLVIMKRLELKSLARTSITIKLVNGMIKSPIGVLRDMVV